MTGTISSPPATARAPPGQKSFCMSTIIRAALLSNGPLLIPLMSWLHEPHGHAEHDQGYHRAKADARYGQIFVETVLDGKYAGGERRRHGRLKEGDPVWHPVLAREIEY